MSKAGAEKINLLKCHACQVEKD